MKNFLKLFSKRDFFVFGLLYLCLFIFSIIDILSIALIPAFVQLITNPQKLNDYFQNTWLLKYLYSHGQDYVILISSIFIAFVFFFKNFFLIIITWAYEKKTANWLSNLTFKLIKKLLNLSYENFLIEDYSKITNIVINEFETIRHYIRTYFVILKEFLVLFFVCISFIYITPSFFMIVFLSMILFSVIFFYFLKNILKVSGSKIFKVKASQIKLMDIIFRGNKYIKIFDRSEYFSKNIFDLTALRNNIGANIGVINILPKLLIELILLILFLIICNLLFSQFKYRVDELIVILSLVAVMVVRLIPIYTNLNASFISLKFSSPAVKFVTEYFKENKEFNLANDNKTFLNDINGFENLEIKNVNYKFKTSASSMFSIKDICFTVKRGEKIGIIGNTGSGKTTLVNCILGLLKPDSGDIVVNKEKSIFKNIKSWHNKLSFVPQDVFLMDSNIYQNIALAHQVSQKEIDLIDDILRLLNLDKFLMNFELNLGDKNARVSEGEKQRIGIARALLKKCELLVLDESTSSLDVNTEKKIIDNLKENFQDLTIITIAHRLTTIKDCDKVLLMESGKLIKIGSPIEVIKYFTEV
jgi:ABC-type multidrug transport system fused ATPase/permease subunit